MMRAAAVAALIAALAGGAAGAGAPPAAGLILPPAVPGSGFAQALTPRSFVFPEDHGPHPQFRQEWWYLSGNLDAADGERFGFELTFFRFALAPPDSAPPPAGASAWRAREVYMAHFAVTDAARARFAFAQKLSRAALGLAGAEVRPPQVWIDDWSLASAGAGGEAWRLRAAQPEYQLELELQALTAPVLNGAAGLSRKADEPGAASYYYSLPRLAARGQLRRAGRVLPVRGLAWLDREWGSGGLGARQAGWDWYALQLDDGSALMFYALRDVDGGRDAHSAGTWIEPTGAAQPLVSAQVAIEVSAHWLGAHGVRYPARWHLSVPERALELDVRPVLAAQELTTTPRYWEGAVDVSGTRAGRALGGRGYVELVGYAEERSAPRAAGAGARLDR